MKEIRAVPAQMMFLQLRLDAARADYRGEAAFTAVNIELWWKMKIRAQPPPGVKNLHGISTTTFPKLSLDFSWPALATRRRWPLATLPCSRKKPSTGCRSQLMDQVCYWLHLCGEKAASLASAMTAALPQQQGMEGTGETGDNSDGDQILLSPSPETQNIFGSFAAAFNSRHYLAGAHPHFKHTPLQTQMIYFNRNLKDEPVEQSQNLSIAAISGSSACRAISV